MLVHHVVTLSSLSPLTPSGESRGRQQGGGCWREQWQEAGTGQEADPWVRHGSVRGGGFWRETLE